jgi:hypothetical protein
MNRREFHKMFGTVLTASLFPAHVFAVIDPQAPGPPVGLTKGASERPPSPIAPLVHPAFITRDRIDLGAS